MAGLLRITGGALVRRNFKVPKAADTGLTRPTGDRARAAIFSSLGLKLEGASVLDLFAGSGAYGFEAISRGAAFVLFVEKSRETAKCIEENSHSLKIESQCQIVIFDAISFVQRTPVRPYDFIFVDPPYSLILDADFWEKLKVFVHKNSVIIFRCQAKKNFSCPLDYQVIRERSYGGTVVFFLNYHDKK